MMRSYNRSVNFIAITGYISFVTYMGLMYTAYLPMKHKGQKKKAFQEKRKCSFLWNMKMLVKGSKFMVVLYFKKWDTE
jgi:hypothetical protein